MKIVYCTDTICHPGGIQVVTMVKARALARIPDNQVWIIVSEKITTPMMEPTGVHIVDLDVNYYEDDWKGYMYRIKGFLVKRRWHKIRMEEILNEIKPDIVVSTGTSEKYFLPALKINSRPVFIREFHFDKKYRQRAACGWKEKLMAYIADSYDYGCKIKNYNKIIVLTEEDKECNWKGWRNVEVIPNPVTGMVDRFSNCESKKAIAAGRLVPQKNFPSLIRIWSKVTERHPDWILEIWGNGLMENKLKDQIEKLGLNGNVFLKGYSNEILTKMGEASIFCLSSKFEGFGLVLVEAMSVGLPVVSYMCPCGPRDIVNDDKDGFLIPLDDETMFADRLCTLMENQELRKGMGREALSTSERYRIDNIIDQWMSLFHMLRDEK